ncbi:MAG: hypothetical protein ABI841_07940 [Chloroflexota bacterium]
MTKTKIKLAPRPVRQRRPNKPRCSFKTRPGAPCRGFGVGADGGCDMHSQDPARIARRRERGAKGGRASSNAARAAKVLRNGPFAHVADQLERAMSEVLEGSLDPNRLNALAQGARSLVIVQDQAEAQARIEALEEQLAAMREGGEERAVFTSHDGRVVEGEDVGLPGAPDLDGPLDVAELPRADGPVH